MSKILLIHLSDLHIKDSNSFSDERKKSIDDVLKKEINGSISETVLLFTGDMTWSGKKEQFDIVNKYIKTLIKYIKTLLPNTHIGFYCCPGNHDIDFDIFYSIEGKIKDKYLISTEEFFNFAATQQMFVENKEFCQKTFRIRNPEIKIDFISVNSTFGSEKTEPDKGLHFLSPDTIKSMKDYQSDNRTILLIHHFEDFFDEQSSLEIRNFIKEKCDFVFFGHTHTEENGTYFIEDKRVGVSRGGALLDHAKESVFSITILDTDTSGYVTRVYEWDTQYRSYNYLKEISNEYNIKTNVDSDFFVKNNTQIMDFPNAKLDDIFVFPDLIFDQNKEKKVSSFDKFIELINDEKKCIVIKGFEKSGKTFFSRYIFHHYAKSNGNPILITKNDKKKTFVLTIKEAYKNQYNAAKFDINRFLKNNISNKILIIDDANIYSAQFISEMMQCSEHFDKIILLCNDKKYVTLYNNGLDLLEPSDLYTFEVQPFIVSKRNELFTKTLKLVSPDIDMAKIEKSLKEMDKIISEQISIVTTNPEFLLLFAKSFGNRTYQSSGSNIFNEVFESNIIISLSKINENLDKKIDISIALGLLEALGYMCFKNAKNIFLEKDLFSIIQERNAKSELKKQVGFNEYNEAFIKSRIVCEREENIFAFISNSYLSYFAARYIQRLVKQRRNKEFMEELKYLSDNISVDLCGDILLFLCYQTGDMSIIEHLVQKANEFYNSKEELNLNGNNTAFLFSGSLPRRALPNEENKQSLRKKQEQKEQKALTFREKTEFEREAKNIANDVFDGFRFVELIGKILPDFIENIENDQLILSCVNSLYKNSHKFLHQLLSPIDEIISKEKKHLEKMDKYDVVMGQDLNDFEKRATAMAYHMIRIVYNSIGRFSSTDSTIKALDSFDNKSIFYTIENLYMHSYIEGNQQYMDKYKIAKNLLDERYSKKRNFLYNLIEDSFILYLIRYPFKYFGELQGLIDTTFLQPEKGKTKSSKKFIEKIKKPKRNA